MSENRLYESQITAVVRGFMQVWNKFESTLSRELTGIEGKLNGMHPHAGEQSNTNYELFFRACNSLYPTGNMTMSEFSTALSVPLSTATRIVDWLVDNGYVQRLHDMDDRRVVRIELTNTGKELYREVDRYIRERVLKILEGLTPEETSILLTLMSKVVTGLKMAAQ